MATERTPYEEHRDYVLAALGRRCSWLDPSDREALLHDAYMVFLEKQRDGLLDADQMCAAQIRAYLTQTALNKAMDEGKRAGRRRSVSLDDEYLGLDPADPGRAPDEWLASRFDDARVLEIVAELPERQQLVIKLRFFFNRSPHEIQCFMGITERVYRRELERATRSLAAQLELVRQGTFCESRRSLILAYVSGIAGPNRVREARRHLDTCPACASWAGELRMAARHASAIAPVPLLGLWVDGLRSGWFASMIHGGRARAIELVAGIRGTAMRHAVQTDPFRLAAFSSARPTAVAVLLTGCLAGGSAATYCVTDGVPSPLRSLLGTGTQPHLQIPRARKAADATARPAAVAHKVIQRSATTTWKRPAPVRVAVVPHRTLGARAHGAAQPRRTEVQRLHRATAPEFGAGGGAPAGGDSAASPPATSGASLPPPTPRKPLPEFDP